MFFRPLVALAFVILPVLAAASCGGAAGATIPTDDAAVVIPGGEDGSLPPDSGRPPLPADGAVPDAPPGAACVGKTGMAGTRSVTITSGGQSRSFDLHVPATYDAKKRTPLVFVFHGYTMTADGIAVASKFASVADAHGMIVAFPSGLNNAFNGGDCCGNADDVGFARDMITSIGGEYCVDAKRVFSTGLSNGGYLSYRLACELSDRIAAIASVAGVLLTHPCAPKRPVPVLHIHGTADVLVPYNGGGAASTPAASDSVDVFKTNNKCAAGAGKVVYEKGDVACTSWAPCAANADVQLCTVTNGGHQWPGGELLPYGGSPSPNLIASEAMANFFEAHPMP